MINEKYKTDMDHTLKQFMSKSASSLKSVNIIEFNDDMIKSKAIRKIAFDVYKVENDPYHSLWTLEDVDGKSYLTRSSDPVYASSSEGQWSTISDYENKNVTLAYKDVPIARFSSEEYGFISDDIGSFKTALLELAGVDQEFIKDVFAEQPVDKKMALISTFPELNKFI